MKVTLDLDKLLEEGKIDQSEYDKLSQLSARTTAALAFNIFVGFGVVAVSGAALALVPTTITAIVLGFLICAAGVALRFVGTTQWSVLANICVLVGALLLGGGLIKEGEGSIASFLIVAGIYAAAGIIARSSLLMVLAVLALASCLGARSGYFHASYFLGIEAPTLTVILFTLFSMVTYLISGLLQADYQRLAIVASRTGVFLVNLGFWIGSLWGDRAFGSQNIPDTAFSLLWAVALISAAIWAWTQDKRWLLNIVAVFGAIHFYTQWFEWLGATAESVLIAGLIALGIAIALRAVNMQQNN